MNNCMDEMIALQQQYAKLEADEKTLSAALKIALTALVEIRHGKANNGVPYFAEQLSTTAHHALYDIDLLIYDANKKAERENQ